MYAHKNNFILLTTEKFGTEKVADFFQSSSEIIHRRRRNASQIFLLVDNSPKNISRRCLQLSERNKIRFVYATPTTPQHKYYECLFQVIKSKLSKYPIGQNKEAYGLSEIELFDIIIEVLAELNENDFAAARRSYFHELKSVL